MGSFTCCIWWLVFGVLLGWLLSWWLSKTFQKIEEENAPPIDKPSLREIYFSDTLPPQPDAAPTEKASLSTELSRDDMLKAASAAGISFSGKQNDLEIIEGIGPKIAELLNNHGIHTFAELSLTSVEAINAILEQGGERFKLADPGTWPEQALLAAENRWQELKALQDYLDGGVNPS
jgi:predicted flap endonuclease-1-like 5' DNA nuclease